MARRFAVLSPLVLCAACAAAGAPPVDGNATPVERRVLVKLNPVAQAAAADAASIAGWASRSAGVPVVYAAATSAAWHALVLRCAPADCDAALQRLAADRQHFDGVEPDALRRAAH